MIIPTLRQASVQSQVDQGGSTSALQSKADRSADNQNRDFYKNTDFEVFDPFQ